MPLVYQQNINEATKIAVWHISETEDFFLNKTILPNNITHPHKRLQHLAGRYLLTELFDDFPLELIKIADTKKPYLADEAFHFSISHCGDYAAVIVSRSYRVGVDIEIISEKAGRLRNKYLSAMEQNLVSELKAGSSFKFTDKNSGNDGHWHTLMWSVKETMFKWYAEGKIEFREHLQIKKLTLNENEFFAHCILSKKEPLSLNVHGIVFNNNILSWIVN